MACSNCNSTSTSTNKTCGCKDTPLTTAPVFTCPPDIKCPDPTPCYETIQDTCVKHSSLYSIYEFGSAIAGGELYPTLPAGASLENAYQAMSVQSASIDCLPPINVHPSYVGTTAIIISWEDTGADTYTIQYGITPSAWTEVGGLLVNSYTLTLLNPNTNYYFKVTSNCNELEVSSTSAIIIVKTLPGL
jgi:hypothetical protein